MVRNWCGQVEAAVAVTHAQATAEAEAEEDEAAALAAATASPPSRPALSLASAALLRALLSAPPPPGVAEVAAALGKIAALGGLSPHDDDENGQDGTIMSAQLIVLAVASSPSSITFVSSIASAATRYAFRVGGGRHRLVHALTLDPTHRLPSTRPPASVDLSFFTDYHRQRRGRGGAVGETADGEEEEAEAGVAWAHMMTVTRSQPCCFRHHCHGFTSLFLSFFRRWRRRCTARPPRPPLPPLPPLLSLQRPRRRPWTRWQRGWRGRWS